jgi:hypothetical protein
MHTRTHAFIVSEAVLLCRALPVYSEKYESFQEMITKSNEVGRSVSEPSRKYLYAWRSHQCFCARITIGRLRER